MKIEDIKFKAKRLDNGEWVEGYFYKECDNTYIIEDKQKESMLNRNESFLVDPTTICQFTGLKDMKGREIWEHDLIAGKPCGNATLEVRYSRGCFKLFDIDGDTVYFELDHIPLDKSNNLEEFRIVGNVFNKDGGEK